MKETLSREYEERQTDLAPPRDPARHCVRPLEGLCEVNRETTGWWAQLSGLSLHARYKCIYYLLCTPYKIQVYIYYLLCTRVHRERQLLLRLICHQHVYCLLTLIKSQSYNVAGVIHLLVWGKVLMHPVYRSTQPIRPTIYIDIFRILLPLSVQNRFLPTRRVCRSKTSQTALTWRQPDTTVVRCRNHASTSLSRDWQKNVQTAACVM